MGQNASAHEGHSSVSDGALVSVVAVCEFDHGVEALAWDSRDGPDLKQLQQLRAAIVPAKEDAAA